MLTSTAPSTASSPAPSPAQDPDLIAGFYEAAANEQRWSGAWTAVCTAFDADTGLLYRLSQASGRPQILAARNWPQSNGAAAMPVSGAAPGGAGAAASAAAVNALLRATTLKAAAAPFGEIRVPAANPIGLFAPGTSALPAADATLCATIPLDGTTMIGMGLHRPAGAPGFTEADRAALDGVGRHVASAIRLEALLAAERRASAIRTSVLDLYPHSIVITTANREIVFANRAASLLAADGSLALANGYLGAGNMRRDEAQRIDELITSVTAGGSGGCTRISRGAGLPLLAAIVEPLPAGMRDEAGCIGRSDELLALITVRDLSATSDTAASYLMDLFGLTGAEAGIVPQLLSGETVSLIAQSRGVAVSTVKAQAAKVLAKTGAANLRALATMISALGCG